MVNKNWTPVDSFVTEYGFRHNKTFIYQPGSGEATIKPGTLFGLDDLRALIKSIEHHELQINIEGTIFVYVPEEPGEEPEAPEEEPEDEDLIGKCPECGLPATHPSGLCRDCHQAKLENDEIAQAIDPELEGPPEAIVEEEKPLDALKVLIPE